MFSINDIEAEGLVSFGSGRPGQSRAKNPSKSASKSTRTRLVRAAEARHANTSGRGKSERTAALEALRAGAANKKISAKKLAALNAAHRRLTTISGR